MSLIRVKLHASTKEVKITVTPLRLVKETPKGYRVEITKPLGEGGTVMLSKENMGKVRETYMSDTHCLFTRSIYCRDTDEDIARIKLMTELQLYIHKIKAEFEPMYNKSLELLIKK